MKRGLIAVAIVVVAALGSFLLVKFQRQPERGRPEPPPPLVRVEEVHTGTVTLDVRSTGEVRPVTSTALVAEVGGTVREVTTRLYAGAFFSKGDLLARIDPRDAQVAVAQARAAHANAELALAREEGEARVARKDWEELGEGEADPLVLREPQLKGARAAVESASAALEKAQLDLERTEIRAPYDGRVRTRRIDIGQFVGPGTPVAEIYATGAAEIRLGLPVDRVRDLDLASVGGKNAPFVTLRAEFGGTWTEWQGRVIRTEGEIDPTTRMLYVIASVEDPFDREGKRGTTLPAGLFVEAVIAGREVADAVVLPRQALRDRSSVFLVEDGALRLVDLEVVRITGDDAVVRGLADGALVCVSNPTVPVDGLKVRVEQPNAEAMVAEGTR